MYDELLKFAVQLAKAAGGIQLAYFRGDRLSIETKSNVYDVVTRADRESEELIAGMIAERYPDHAILGEEGYDAALKFQPNIIITDIRMPKMDGIEMLKRLREAGCKSEVIILTAYSDFEYAQNALHYGAADYLLKPFHDGELEQVIVSIHSRLMARQGNAAESLPALQLKKGDKSKYVMESLAYIAGHYNDPDIGVGSIAANAGISEGYLCHIFKKETNYTLMEYLSQYRMHVAMQLLRDCRVKIYEVAEQVGYRDIAYFSSMFRKIVGVTPSEYQDRCK